MPAERVAVRQAREIVCLKFSAGLNDERPLRRLGVTRRQLLEQIDRPALKPLPAEPYEFSEWRRCRVGIDYHVEIAAHYYSVPHRFARAEVDARLTVRTDLP
jgi:hypothetical protein